MRRQKFSNKKAVTKIVPRRLVNSFKGFGWNVTKSYNGGCQDEFRMIKFF